MRWAERYGSVGSKVFGALPVKATELFDAHIILEVDWLLAFGSKKMSQNLALVSTVHADQSLSDLGTSSASC